MDLCQQSNVCFLICCLGWLSLFCFFNFLFFYFTILYWFCHTLTWICHGCIRAPNPESPSHLPLHIISLDHPCAPAPSMLYPVSNIDWHFVSYMIVYMFQCHSPKSSHPLPLPHSPIDSLNQYVLNEWTGMTVAIQVAFGEIISLRQVRQCWYRLGYYHHDYYFVSNPFEDAKHVVVSGK